NHKIALFLSGLHAPFLRVPGKTSQPHASFLDIRKDSEKLKNLPDLRQRLKGFSPEDLSVRQVGRKLRVSGKMEKKQEDGKGFYSYSLQEFRQEFDLPEGVNHEDVSCHLSPDGKLHIQAAKVPCIEGTERELTIKRSSEEEPQQSVCSQSEDSRAETQNRS
uniref:SHSP domain-containing protein n=1 Tax=Xiphophorus couchianus TaxID=32473 RepID=A0A3B5LBS0_9TELE